MDVSIIIPVYNAAGKLSRCLDSLLMQDFNDFECLMVDDGSTDGSADICDRYVHKDTRFRVIHKQNGGVSSARNMALEQARGEWIVFVDSDDSITANHLSSFLSKADKNIDWVLCGYQDVLPKQQKQHCYEAHTYVGNIDVTEFLCHSEFLDYMIPWDKMFRRSIIEEHHLQFDESLSISEDRLFCYQYMMYVRGIATTGEVTYIHDATDQNSLSNRVYPFSMQAHRCKKLHTAMIDLLQHYGIGGDDAYPFVSYDWGILKSAMLAAMAECGSILKAEKPQRQLLHDCFDASLFGTSGSKCHSLISNTREDRMIANGQFLLLNIYTKLRKLFNQLS